MYSNYYFLTVENTSVYDLDITANITFYNDDDIVGVETRTVNTVASGQESAVWTMPDEQYTRTSVSFEVSQCSFCKPATEDFEYEVLSQTTSKLILKGKNKSDSTINSVSAEVLFFKEGQIVGHDSVYFVDSNFELPAHSEVTKESELYSTTFDSFQIYINAYRY